MITYKDILFSTTKILSDNFNCDVIVQNQEGTFENECFYVTLVPVTSKASTLRTNEKQLMISVKYFGGSKLDNYDIADKLESLFARSLKVNNRVLNISNVEPNFLQDEVGDMLDFLIYTTYFDEILTTQEDYELMQELNIFTCFKVYYIKYRIIC